MKRIYRYMVMAACAMVMVGCQKDLEGVLTAVIEDYQNEEGKVYVDDARYAYWHDGDKVMVNGNEGTIALQLDGSAKIVLENGAVLQDNNTAVYPKSSYVDGSSVKFPQTQVYRESFNLNGVPQQVIDAPMVAYSSGMVLNFHNVGALMKVTFQNPEATDAGDITVERIELIGNEGKLLWGKVGYTQVVDGAPTITGISEGGNMVILSIPNDENGYGVIANGQSKSYYIAVPTATEVQMNVKVYYKRNSDNMKATWSTTTPSATKSIVRNTIGMVNLANVGVDHYHLNYKYFYGRGIQEDPYQIETSDDLNKINMMCTNGTTSTNGTAIYFKQMGDITITDPAHYVGIGTNDNPFMGNYDGNGKMITLGSSTGAKSMNSLFECISTGASISNLIVEAYIHRADEMYTRGGLVGTIKSGSQNVIIDNCLVKGKITGSYLLLGGICGGIISSGNSGAIEIKDCVSEIDADGVSQMEFNNIVGFYGGIIGDIASSTVNVINCRNKGLLFIKSGGIIGQCWDGSNVTINKCLNLRKIKYWGEMGGGIVGGIKGAGTHVTILNSANYGQLSAEASSYVGGMVGHIISDATATINNCHVNYLIYSNSKSVQSGGIVGKVDGGTCNINNVYLDVERPSNPTKFNWVVGSGSATCANVYRPADDNTANDVDENGVPSGVSTYTATDLLGNMNDNIPAGDERWSNISITMPNNGGTKDVVGFKFEEQPVGPQRP